MTTTTETLGSFAKAVLDGLALPQKRIPSKFFYDQDGSELFDRICETKDYYVTRVETEILRNNAKEIAQYFSESVLLEFGSGVGRKSRILLENARNLAAYVPIDISSQVLQQSSKKLWKDFPQLKIIPLCADFTRRIEFPKALEKELALPYVRRSAFFPGSTIGNFEPAEAAIFLRNVGELLGEGGRFAVGIDLIKSLRVMEQAYNDGDGVTAMFNLNLLNRINAELDGNFNLEEFKHEAFFNTDQSRMEMHLVSLRTQEVRVLGKKFRFKENETIHTESSYKYTLEGFEDLARASGFDVTDYWMDRKSYFAVFLLEKGIRLLHDAGCVTKKSA